MTNHTSEVVTANRTPDAYHLPCDCGVTLRSETAPGCHLCPECRAPAILAVKLVPHYTATVLTEKQAAILADLDDCLEDRGGIGKLSAQELGRALDTAHTGCGRTDQPAPGMSAPSLFVFCVSCVAGGYAFAEIVSRLLA